MPREWVKHWKILILDFVFLLEKVLQSLYFHGWLFPNTRVHPKYSIPKNVRPTEVMFSELWPVLECCLWGQDRDETLCVTFLSAGPVQTASAFLEPCTQTQGIVQRTTNRNTNKTGKHEQHHWFKKWSDKSLERADGLQKHSNLTR